jgi:hypothetical protein
MSRAESLGDKLRRLAWSADQHPEWTLVIAVAGDEIVHNCYSSKVDEFEALEEVVTVLKTVVLTVNACADELQ